MGRAKVRRLRAVGWKTETTKDFLGLGNEEWRLMELKLSFAGALKQA